MHLSSLYVLSCKELIFFQMRDLLGCCYDIERCLQRLTLGRGGPRDLHSIAITDEYVKKISEQIRKFQKGYGFSIPNGLKSILAHVDEKELEILSEIKQAIKENPPISDNEGDFIADGYPLYRITVNHQDTPHV